MADFKSLFRWCKVLIGIWRQMHCDIGSTVTSEALWRRKHCDVGNTVTSEALWRRKHCDWEHCIVGSTVALEALWRRSTVTSEALWRHQVSIAYSVSGYVVTWRILRLESTYFPYHLVWRSERFGNRWDWVSSFFIEHSFVLLTTKLRKTALQN